MKLIFVGAPFQLNPGEKVGLVGPNGAGKTTLFRMVVGEEAPDEGDVSVPKKAVERAPGPIGGYRPAEGDINWNCVQIMNWERLKRITVEEGKCGGRPCIRGQRIRVTDVLELLASGASFDEILRDYPFLEREDILAAIDYAAHQTDHVIIQAS